MHKSYHKLNKYLHSGDLTDIERARLAEEIVLEPGGAVALAAALFLPNDHDSVIALATGGNVDRAMMARALSS